MADSVEEANEAQKKQVEIVLRHPASEEEWGLVRRVRQEQKALRPGYVSLFTLEIDERGIYLYDKRTHEHIAIGQA